MSRTDFADRSLLPLRLRGLLGTPGPGAVFRQERNGSRGPRRNVAMPSRRLLLGIGFAILLATSAASIALDAKSRSEVAWINHTLEVSNKLKDMRLLFRRAESAARGYLLSGDQSFVEDYHQSLDQAPPAFAVLKRAIKDNPAQLQLVADSEALVIGRFAAASEMVGLYAAGNVAGLAALAAEAEGRALMAAIGVNFDRLADEEQRLLAIRSAVNSAIERK